MKRYLAFADGTSANQVYEVDTLEEAREQAVNMLRRGNGPVRIYKIYGELDITPEFSLVCPNDNEEE